MKAAAVTTDVESAGKKGEAAATTIPSARGAWGGRVALASRRLGTPKLATPPSLVEPVAAATAHRQP